MKKSRFSETQIIGILKAVEAGRMVKDVCREHGISDATYYQWKSKYGGMEACRHQAAAGVGRREPEAQDDGRRPEPGEPGD